MTDPRPTGDLRAMLGPIGVWGHLATMPADRLRPVAERTARLGYGTLWVGDGTARDPFALLAAVAEAAGPMALGTSVLNIFGRDAMAARMGALTLHELTGGRYVLGLGVSHAHLVQTLRGHVYERPLTRMREYLDRYAALPYRGPTLDSSAGHASEPPVMLAALRRGMLELAATRTAGTLPFLVSAARIAWIREVLDAATPSDRPPPIVATALAVVLEADAQRARATGRAWLAPYCRAQNYQRSLAQQGFGPDDWEPPYSDRLVDDIVAWGDADAIHDRIGTYRAAGADHVAIIPLADDGSATDPLALEALAPRS